MITWQAYESVFFCPTCTKPTRLGQTITKCCKAEVAHKFICNYCLKELIEQDYHKDCERINRKD